MGKVRSVGLSVLVLMILGVPISSWSPSVKGFYADDMTWDDLCPQVAVDSPGNSYVWVSDGRDHNDTYGVKVDASGMIRNASGLVWDASGMIR